MNWSRISLRVGFGYTDKSFWKSVRALITQISMSMFDQIFNYLKPYNNKELATLVFGIAFSFDEIR